MPRAFASKYIKHLKIDNRRRGASKTLCEATGRAEIIGLPTYVHDKENVTCPECKKELAERRLHNKEKSEFEKNIELERWEIIAQALGDVPMWFAGKKNWLTGKKAAKKIMEDNDP